MAFDIGGLFGGGLGGAAAGSAFGPIGTIAGGILGGLGGAFGGGGPQGYQMTPLQEDLSSYGRKQVRATKGREEAIEEQFKSLLDSGNRGAAEAFLESYRDRFSNPKFIERRLAKSYSKPIDFTRGGFQSVADQLYREQGLNYSSQDFGNFVERAKGLGIRSPQAFGDMLKRELISSGKVLTPQQEAFQDYYGKAERDASGRLTGRYGSPVEKVKSLSYQYGA